MTQPIEPARSNSAGVLSVVAYLFFTFTGSWTIAAETAAREVAARQLSSFEGASGYAGVATAIFHAGFITLAMWVLLIFIRRYPSVTIFLTVVFGILSLPTFGFLVSLLT